MIARLLLLLWLTLPWSLASAQPDPEAILVLGDSLSAAYGIDREESWVRLLEARVREHDLNLRVINASVSGETTAGGLTRLPALLERHRPTVLIIELGANDGLRGLSFAVIRENLTALIREARERGARVVLLGVRLPPNYGAVYTQGFQAVFHEVAQREQVALVPAMLADIAEQRDLMQADGLHPGAAAQLRILDNLWPTLEPVLRAAPDEPIPTPSS